MPKVTLTPRALFNKRVSSLRAGFPRQQQLLTAYHQKIREAELNRERISDKRTLGGIRRMLTFAQKRLEDIVGAMQQDAELVLPGEIAAQLSYVILNTRLLISRIENLGMAEPRMLERVEADEYEEVYDDIDPLTALGKKIH